VLSPPDSLTAGARVRVVPQTAKEGAS